MKFRKSDLRDGDIVTYRDGRERIVTQEQFRRGAQYMGYEDYTEDLKDKDGDVKYDIVKVERPIQYKTVFERKEDILDEAEKRYLRSVIKPFRKQVKTISKQKEDYQIEYIQISLEDTAGYLPDFRANTMYKNMEENREYTLEELGL